MKDKKKQKLILLLLIIIGLALIGTGTYLYLNKDNKTETKEEEKAPNLKDDFYANINYKKSDSPFIDAQISAFQNLAEIGQEIENDDNYTDINYFNFFETYDDFEGRDITGLGELKEYLDEIENAVTLDDFSNVVVKVTYDLGVNSFLNYGIAQDYYDNSKNVLYFMPMTLETLRIFYK